MKWVGSERNASKTIITPSWPTTTATTNVADYDMTTATTLTSYY
jgi:hypothetical protein